MQKYDLNGIWRMQGAGFDCLGNVPGSVYTFLLDAKLADDPYYRENELEALKILNNEFTFSRKFDFLRTSDKVLLHFDGLDTLTDIYLNGNHVAYTDNMHRTYEFDVTDIISDGENEIKIVFYPIDPYIKKKHAEQKTLKRFQDQKALAKKSSAKELKLKKDPNVLEKLLLQKSLQKTVKKD